MSKKKEKIWIRSEFEHCIDEKILELLLRNASVLCFGGVSKRLTVLFSDIRSFTNYFEKQSPEETVSNLNEYFTKMVDVIHNYSGTLDKFIGDAMMVEFGVPTHFPNHAERACMAALEMVRSLDQLRERWMQEGKEVFDIRIGINTGHMLAGNFGSEQLFDYTVLGDNVNFGLRLKDISKIYNPSNHIIISEFTKNELSDKMVTRELDCIRVKGKAEPVVVFELVGEKNSLAYTEDFLTHFNEALIRYKKREFHRALEEFKKALVLYEDSVSKLYVNRCESFINNPPPENWHGVCTKK